MAARQARAARAVAKARSLSAKGKTHQRNRDQLNAQAAQYIFDGGSVLLLIDSRMMLRSVHSLMIKEPVHRKQQAAADGVGGPARITRTRSNQVHTSSYQGEMLQQVHALLCTHMRLRSHQDSRARGLHELRLIVGKGNRSPSGIAKIKPAVCSFLQRIQLSAQVDQRNTGVLIVQL